MSLLVKGLLGGIVGGSNQFLKKLHEEAELERQKALNEQQFNQNVELAGINHDYRLEETGIAQDRADARSQKEFENSKSIEQFKLDNEGQWEKGEVNGVPGLVHSRTKEFEPVVPKPPSLNPAVDKAVDAMTSQITTLGKELPNADPETAKGIQKEIDGLWQRITYALQNNTLDAPPPKATMSADQILLEFKKANPNKNLSDKEIADMVIAKAPHYASVFEGHDFSGSKKGFTPPPPASTKGTGKVDRVALKPHQDIPQNAFEGVAGAQSNFDTLRDTIQTDSNAAQGLLAGSERSKATTSINRLFITAQQGRANPIQMRQLLTEAAPYIQHMTPEEQQKFTALAQKYGVQ